MVCDLSRPAGQANARRTVNKSVRTALICWQLLKPAAHRRAINWEGASQVAVQPATARSVGSSRMAAAR
jgi:hypothetical protein